MGNEFIWKGKSTTTIATTSTNNNYNDLNQEMYLSLNNLPKYFCSIVSIMNEKRKRLLFLNKIFPPIS